MTLPILKSCSEIGLITPHNDEVVAWLKGTFHEYDNFTLTINLGLN